MSFCVLRFLNFQKSFFCSFAHLYRMVRCSRSNTDKHVFGTHIFILYCLLPLNLQNAKRRRELINIDILYANAKKIVHF